MKLSRWKIALALLILICIGISIYIWNYNHQIHDPFLQIVQGPPGQPKTREEAQKRANFTIFRPAYKPASFNLNGTLVLSDNDKYATLAYQQNTTYLTSIHSNESYGIQIEETKATPEQETYISKKGILANNPYATDIRQINVCGSVGYTEVSDTAQDIIFIKDETRILLIYFKATLPYVYLTDDELLHVSCSLKPLIAS